MNCSYCGKDHNVSLVSEVAGIGLHFCSEKCLVSALGGEPEEGYMVEGENGGKKSDGGKRMWELVYWPFLDGLIDVLTHGAKKYEPNNWKKVERYRYEAAIMRHISLYMQGEKNDTETGLSHLYHIACTAMFLDYYDSINKNG